MKFQHSLQKGFTLVELIIVIAIIGVLAAVLITIIDPLDKINSANDTGAVNTIAQLGKGNDSYAVNNSNLYASAQTFNAAVTALNTAGETKYSTVTAPNGYTYSFYAPANCGTDQAQCTTYVFATTLKSKKYPTGSFYIYANGKGCTTTTTPSATSTCP